MKMVLVWVFRKNTNKDGLTGNGRKVMEEGIWVPLCRFV